MSRRLVITFLAIFSLANFGASPVGALEKEVIKKPIAVAADLPSQIPSIEAVVNQLQAEAAYLESIRVPEPPRVIRRTAPVTTAQAPTPSAGSPWDRVNGCEATGRWDTNTGNGYYGGLQMDMSFWNTYDGPEFASRPDLATREQQIIVAERARDGYGRFAARGYGPWPHCGRLA